jgi:hypothetical protein
LQARATRCEIGDRIADGDVEFDIVVDANAPVVELESAGRRTSPAQPRV